MSDLPITLTWEGNETPLRFADVETAKRHTEGDTKISDNDPHIFDPATGVTHVFAVYAMSYLWTTLAKEALIYGGDGA